MILTWLYVPGDRPEVVAKALRSGADAIIVDLEDAVSASRKEYARAATAERLAERPPVPVFVRVNALDSPWAGADLTALTGLRGLAGLRLPKISAPEQIVAVADRTGGVTLHAMLESALGVERAYEIARAHPALRALSSARPTSGPTWASARTRAWTGRAPAWWSRHGRRDSPRPHSRCSPTSGTWRRWPAPVPAGGPWASWAGRRSTRASCR